MSRKWSCRTSNLACCRWPSTGRLNVIGRPPFQSRIIHANERDKPLHKLLPKEDRQRTVTDDQAIPLQHTNTSLEAGSPVATQHDGRNRPPVRALPPPKTPLSCTRRSPGFHGRSSTRRGTSASKPTRSSSLHTSQASPRRARRPSSRPRRPPYLSHGPLSSRCNLASASLLG